MRVRLPEIPEKESEFVDYAVELNRTVEQAFDDVYNIISTRVNVESTSMEIVTASANLGRNSVILVDSSGGNVAITLPPPKSCYRAKYTVKKISSDGNSVTVAARDSGNVDGVSTYLLSGGTYPVIEVISDGYNYWVI